MGIYFVHLKRRVGEPKGIEKSLYLFVRLVDLAEYFHRYKYLMIKCQDLRMRRTCLQPLHYTEPPPVKGFIFPDRMVHAAAAEGWNEKWVGRRAENMVLFRSCLGFVWVEGAFLMPHTFLLLPESGLLVGGQ